MSEKYISKEQQAVVNARLNMGYTVERMDNGYWLCYKGKHKMIINGCGWDTYTGVR